MKQTKARKQFKKLFGQQNHFLITCLIGLDYVENYDVKCPDSFSTSWNPKEKRQSTRRSREFLLQSFLASAVDGLDMYLSLLNRTPKYVTDSKFEEVVSAAGRSVYCKVENVSNYFSINQVCKALCLALITLRNNLLHSMADNTLSTGDCEILCNNKVLIKEKYCGLNIEDILKRISEKEAPTFKEVASLIRATHFFVEEVDSKVIDSISDSFYYETLCKYLRDEKKLFEKYKRFSNLERKRLIENIFENRLGITKGDISDDVMEELLVIKDLK